MVFQCWGLATQPALFHEVKQSWNTADNGKSLVTPIQLVSACLPAAAVCRRALIWGTASGMPQSSLELECLWAVWCLCIKTHWEWAQKHPRGCFRTWQRRVGPGQPPLRGLHTAARGACACAAAHHIARPWRVCWSHVHDCMGKIIKSCLFYRGQVFWLDIVYPLICGSGLQAGKWFAHWQSPRQMCPLISWSLQENMTLVRRSLVWVELNFIHCVQRWRTHDFRAKLTLQHSVLFCCMSLTHICRVNCRSSFPLLWFQELEEHVHMFLLQADVLSVIFFLTVSQHFYVFISIRMQVQCSWSQSYAVHLWVVNS